MTIPLNEIDLLMGILPGDAETLCQFRNGGFVQLVIFEKSLFLFRRGNTFPRQELNILQLESVTHALIICVTDVFRVSCNLCL
jgi:hypothetical protein